MKIGIFGGSFNPVHLGHIKVAQDVKSLLKLDEVWFMCASFPPHKRDVQPYFHRYNMLNLALKHNPYLFPSDLEIKKKFLFTVDTLSYLNNVYGEQHDFYFLIGFDAFLEITTWKNWKKLFTLANFVIFNRSSSQENLKKLLKNFFSIDVKHNPATDTYNYKNKTIYSIKVKSLNISGSEVRELSKKGGDISTFVTKEVLDYIEANNLYR